MASQYQHRRRGAITPIITVACGEDKPATGGGGGVPAADYPCVRRSSQRRLLTFLWLQGFKAAFGSIAGETDAFFSVPLLRQLVEKGKWADARGYLSRFLPPDNGRLGVEAEVLQRFLHLHGLLASIVDGSKDSESVAANYNTCLNHGKTIFSGNLRIRSIVLNALHAKQYFRASLDWERVRRKASEIVDELAYRTPELKELVLMPGGPMKPHNVLPGSHDELLDKALNWAADAIGAPCIPDLQSTLGTLTNHAMKSLKSLVSSVRGTGAPVAPVYRTMYGNMAGPVRNPSVPVLANANIFANPMLRTPAAPGAPFSGSMFRAPPPVLQTILNHVLTPGAPFSATMFHPPVSRTVYGRLTNPDKSSGISLTTSAGTNKHSGQENVESSQQALNPEIHPRAELTTSNEQGLDPDRKPSTGALDIGDKN